MKFAVIGFLVAAGAICGAADSHSKVEKMYITRTVKSDQKPSAAGYYFSSDDDGNDEFVELESDAALEHLKEFPYQGKPVAHRYTAPISSSGKGYVPVTYIGPHTRVKVTHEYDSDEEPNQKTADEPTQNKKKTTHHLSDPSFDISEFIADEGLDGFHHSQYSDVYKDEFDGKGYGDVGHNDAEYDRLVSDVASFIYTHGNSEKPKADEEEQSDADDFLSPENEQLYQEIVHGDTYSDGSPYEYSSDI